jgi:endonuclease YncB( thermonuclease family)
MGNQSTKHTIRALNRLQIDKIPDFIKNRTRIARVVSCYDGDTCTVVFLAGKESISLGVRLYGIDTAEMPKRKDKSDRSAEEVELAEAARTFLSNKVRNQCVMVDFKKWDKWGGRALGDLYLLDKNGNLQGSSLNQQLLDAGLAVKYHGEKKNTDWIDFHKKWKKMI